MTPGNPFSAERTSEWVGTPIFTNSPLQRSSELVARDSAGRVRIERVVGKYKIISGAEAGNGAEQKMIRICDPVSHQLIMLDTLNKTGRIIAQNAPNPPNAAGSSVAFCNPKENLFKSPNFQIEELGHKLIEGLDTKGLRITLLHPVGQPGAAGHSNQRELWCSEEMGAVLLEISPSLKEGVKRESKLEKLQRVEPDPSLFQIPADYTLTERVQEHPQMQLNKPAVR
jgi:hypothetical protein